MGNSEMGVFRPDEEKKLDHGEYLGITEKVEIKLTDSNRDDVLERLVEDNPDIVQTVFIGQSFDGGESSYGYHAQWNADEPRDLIDEAKKLAEANGGAEVPEHYRNIGMTQAKEATFHVWVQKYKKPE